MGEGSHLSARLDKWSKITEIASHLAIVVGVVISVFQLIDFVDNAKRATQTAKLSALKEIKTFLKEDEDIRRRGQQFHRP